MSTSKVYPPLSLFQRLFQQILISTIAAGGCQVQVASCSVQSPGPQLPHLVAVSEHALVEGVTHDVKLGHRVDGDALDGLVKGGLATVAGLLCLAVAGLTIPGLWLLLGVWPHHVTGDLVMEVTVIRQLDIIAVVRVGEINGERRISPGPGVRVPVVSVAVDVTGGQIRLMSDT